VIEVNKFNHNGTHFESPHAILGLTTYILLAIQTFVGFTQYFTPQLYGSGERAQSLYKWHRISGYVVLAFLLATISAATQTDFNKTTLDIKLWAVLISAALVLIGVLPRIKKQKLGLGAKASGGLGQ
jgi:Eukaryotic cytochrome b561